jgi:hypothetical protein
MAGESSRVDVGRVVAGWEDDSEGEGEGEEYAEVEDIVCAWNPDRRDWEDRLESRKELLL